MVGYSFLVIVLTFFILILSTYINHILNIFVDKVHNNKSKIKWNQNFLQKNANRIRGNLKLRKIKKLTYCLLIINILVIIGSIVMVIILKLPLILVFCSLLITVSIDTGYDYYKKLKVTDMLSD